MRLIFGFLLAFVIGVVCRLARIPSPAPQAIVGALLVASMSTGYVLTERWLGRPSKMISSLSQPQIPLQFGEKSCK
jgi:XapX domain-containing protein